MTGSPNARRTLRERIRAYAGLDPPEWLLDARLDERARALDLAIDAYLERAAGDDGAAGRELEALSELLRVGETRFFRHRAHVQQLQARVLPERARAAQLAGRRLRAWSAGCATGEEAWTLAMLMDGLQPPAGFEVLATDLSEDALAVGRIARYPEARTTDVPPELKARYLTNDARGFTVAGRLRGRVTFSRHNLLDARYPTGGFDVVLCRNVLIYFDAQTRAQVVQRLAEALQEGGYLFVGYSETLRDDDAFEAIRDDDGVIWRKRAAEQLRRPAPKLEPPARSPSLLPEPVAPVTAPAPPAKEKPPAPPRVSLHGDYHDATRLSHELRAILQQPGAAVVDLDGADYLGDDAARVLKRALKVQPAIELRASRPAVMRWLERHGLGTGGGA